MLQTSLRTVTMVTALLLPTAPSCADDKTKGSGAKTAREVVAQFAKGDPGWKVRMEALVTLVKSGPAAVPVLVDALKNGSPSSREFATQALAVIADPCTRPALVRALSDREPGVRIYAVRALSMLGRLELTEPQRQVIEADSHWMLRHYIASTLAQDAARHPGAIRKALMDFDLTRMDTARLGQVAPEFSLPDGQGNSYRLSRFRGKKTVVLEFNSGDD